MTEKKEAILILALICCWSCQYKSVSDPVQAPEKQQNKTGEPLLKQTAPSSENKTNDDGASKTSLSVLQKMLSEHNMVNDYNGVFFRAKEKTITVTVVLSFHYIYPKKLVDQQIAEVERFLQTFMKEQNLNGYAVEYELQDLPQLVRHKTKKQKKEWGFRDYLSTAKPKKPES